MYNETRFQVLQKGDPSRSQELLQLAKDDVAHRWDLYHHLTLDQTPKPAAPTGAEVESRK